MAPNPRNTSRELTLAVARRNELRDPVASGRAKSAAPLADTYKRRVFPCALIQQSVQSTRAFSASLIQWFQDLAHS